MPISIGRCISRILRSWRIFGLIGKTTLSDGSVHEKCNGTKRMHGRVCVVLGTSGIVSSALGVYL